MAEQYTVDTFMPLIDNLSKEGRMTAVLAAISSGTLPNDGPYRFVPGSRDYLMATRQSLRSLAEADVRDVTKGVISMLNAEDAISRCVSVGCFSIPAEICEYLVKDNKRAIDFYEKDRDFYNAARLAYDSGNHKRTMADLEQGALFAQAYNVARSTNDPRAPTYEKLATMLSAPIIIQLSL